MLRLLFASLLALTFNLASAQSPSAQLGPEQSSGADIHTGALLTARTQAEQQVAVGELRQAGKTILTSLRSVPPDRPDLADTAYGNVQFIVFAMEYLMPDTVVQGFLAEDLESESQVTDRLVDTMYNIFLGQDTPEKTLAAQEMTYLSTSENKIVCAIALFNLANPYFYDNTEFTTQHATRLAEEFPDSELARMAQNLPVLSYRKTDHLPTQEDTKFSTKSTNLDWTSSFQARVEQLAESLDSKASSKTALAPMQDGALNASDWRERFACLLMLEDERKGGNGSNVRPIAEELARRAGNAPDVVRARILLARQNSRAAAENAHLNSARDASVYWADALLDTKITQLTPERTLWEDRMKAIKFCAQDLKEGGHLTEAEKLYSALAAEFPNSLVEQECNEAVAEIHSQSAARVSQ